MKVRSEAKDATYDIEDNLGSDGQKKCKQEAKGEGVSHCEGQGDEVEGILTRCFALSYTPPIHVGSPLRRVKWH